MKLFNIRELYKEQYREYIVGSADTGRHSVYLVYGEVPQHEERRMAPDGHDEILFLLSGDATLEGKDGVVPIAREQAVFMGPDEAYTFKALTECSYVVAGTHTTSHEHEH